MFVLSSLTWPADSESFPQSLPTPALDRHDTAVVWGLRLHGDPGGPTSVTGTARFVLAIFSIALTLLSGHTSARSLSRLALVRMRRLRSGNCAVVEFGWFAHG